MKNKKGEINPTVVIIIAIAAIVGMVLLQATASYTGAATTTASWSNKTVAVSTATYTDIQGAQNSVGSYTITNATGGETIASTNLSIVERVGDDGQLTLSILKNDARWNSKNVNVTGTYGPDGYINDSGGRSVAGLIILFFAIAIAIAVLVPSIRDSILDKLNF